VSPLVAELIDGALFECTLDNPVQIAKSLTATHPKTAQHFRDSYLLEFLGLPSIHKESDL
jgi:predicted nuclease of restriction endonuclease-like (RecB) superfamily